MATGARARMTNRFKFTDERVRKLSAEKTTWYSDEIVRRPQLAVGPTSKTFYVTRPHQRRVAGRSYQARQSAGYERSGGRKGG